jgi:hypothetical protein
MVVGIPPSLVISSEWFEQDQAQVGQSNIYVRVAPSEVCYAKSWRATCYDKDNLLRFSNQFLGTMSNSSFKMSCVP